MKLVFQFRESLHNLRSDTNTFSTRKVRTTHGPSLVICLAQRIWEQVQEAIIH